MFLHIHELMRATSDEQRHIMERFWVISQYLKDISGVEVFESLPCLGNWNRAKEAEDIKAMGDVGVAMLTRHVQSSH